MQITARQPVETTIVAVAAGRTLSLPEPAAVFNLFPEGTPGATYFDDAALGVRAFTVPHQKLRLTFERMRVRVEDTGSRQVADMPLAEVMARLIEQLYPPRSFVRYGFNYDVVYRYDQVLPSREVLGAFLKPDMIEDVSHFGWQCTITRDKGKRRETYFFKFISPLELQVLANLEFDRPLPDAEALAEELRTGYTDSQKILEQLTLTS